MAGICICYLWPILAWRVNNRRKQNRLAAYACLLTLHSSGGLPPDPLTRGVPESRPMITIVFRNYTIAISRADSKDCILAALGDVVIHRDQGRVEVSQPLEYAWGTVELSINPTGSMRWKEMLYLVRMLHAWWEEYESVDMNFDVVMEGTGTVGTGRLGNVLWDHQKKTRTEDRSAV